jgi:hypothetical protein
MNAVKHSGYWGVPPAQMQPGSGHSLQVLAWITTLRAFRCCPSREAPANARRANAPKPCPSNTFVPPFVTARSYRKAARP